MERSPLGTLAAIAVVAVLCVAGLWLFALDQVTDTTTLEAAADIQETLGRSLDAAGKVKITMVREGKGVDAPRRYIVRYKPSAALAADEGALERLSLRAGRILIGRLDRVNALVGVHCVADLGGGRDAQQFLVRVGSRGSWNLERQATVPPLPVPGGAMSDATGDTEESP